MFGIFKKDNLSSALDGCQAYHKRIGLGQELTQQQLDMVKSMSAFKDIDARFKENGLTKYGGLAWFSTQTITNLSKTQNMAIESRTLALELVEKFVSVSLAIGNSVPELKLTKADMGPIERGCHAATEWLNTNPIVKDIEKLEKWRN